MTEGENKIYVTEYFVHSAGRYVDELDLQKIRLPGLLGMLITGIVLGPYALNLLDQSILGISADLRKLP